MNLNFKKKINYSRQGILSKELAKNNKYSLTLFCLAKNTEISEHTSSREGIVEIIEGKGWFNLAGKKIRMVPGEIIFLKKNQKHSLKAGENLAFLLTLVK